MTATAQGRLTANPWAHIDLIGTIILPIVMFMVVGIGIGYPKSLPIDPNQIRGPRRNLALVASAGVAANFAMAFAWMVVSIMLAYFGVTETFFLRVAHAGVLVNIVWVAFNLFPLPPVDGGQIIAWLLPPRLGEQFQRVAPFSFFIIIGLAILGVLNYWLVPVMGLVQSALDVLVSPLSLLFR